MRSGSTLFRRKTSLLMAKIQSVRLPITFGSASSLPVSAKPTALMNASDSQRAAAPQANINATANAKAIRTATPVRRQHSRSETSHL